MRLLGMQLGVDVVDESVLEERYRCGSGGRKDCNKKQMQRERDEGQEEAEQMEKEKYDT